jgi:hypothetical protein
MLERGEKLEWVDPKSRLKVVLAPTGGGAVTLVSTFWKGQPDPPPPQGACALPKHARYSPSTDGMVMDKLAHVVAARFELEAAKARPTSAKKRAQRIEALRKSIGDLRRKYKRDLKSSDPEKSMTALAVALIDHTYERGEDEGVTSWKKRHVTFGPKDATVKYTSGGVKMQRKVTDAVIKQALREACEACDQDNGPLFSGEWGSVTGAMIGDYLEPFGLTANDIRGFQANREMQARLKALRADGEELPRDKKAKEKLLKAEFEEALVATAEAVGHEPSTLRSQYLIPGLEEQYLKSGAVSDKFSTVLDPDERSIEERVAARALFDLL